MVSGLPTHISASRISGRLNQISDNCGGKVLGVDPRTGTARIRFRTHELAAKYVSIYRKATNLCVRFIYANYACQALVA